MKKVLVVDDTKNIRLLLTKCLELEGYEVTAASDGKQAVMLMESDHFDLVFLDIKLPEIRGTEVLKRIREMGIQTPVIIITAYATVKNAVECTQMGAFAYLQKPFTADKIKSVLSDFRNSRQNDAGFRNNGIWDMDKIKVLIERKAYTEALNLLGEALSKELTNPDLFLLISQVYEGLGNTEYAEKYLKAYKLFKSNDI